jgi:hypothetical protein
LADVVYGYMVMAVTLQAITTLIGLTIHFQNLLPLIKPLPTLRLRLRLLLPISGSKRLATSISKSLAEPLTRAAWSHLALR